LRAQRGNYVANELLQAQEVSLQAFPWLSVPLPDLRTTGAERIVEFESNAGYSDELGAFAHALALVPVGAQFALGGRLGLYSERGVLVGPAAAFDSGDGIKAAFSSGWIRDHNLSRRGLDVIGSPIDRDRGFIEWSLHSRSNDDRLQVNSAGWVVSDSEVLRDFVDNAYERNFQPDAFAAFTWQNGPWVVDLLARAQLNDYYGMVERLPELRIEYLPTPIADSGLWMQAFMVATRYRQQALDPLLYALQPLPPALGLPSLPAGSATLPSELVATDTFSRVETGFTVLRPFHFAGGVDLTLRASGRWSSFHHSATTTRDLRSEARTVGELGADLQQTLARDFRWQDRRGRAIRMRHISRTFAQYRWHPGAEDQPSIVPAFDILPYSPMAPVINLADIQHSDGIRDWSLLRFGWEHRFQRSVDGAPARDWLLLSATQDLRFDSDPGEPDWDGLYLAADFRPYPWLRLQYAQKLNADSGNTESTLVRAAINSSDIWSVGLTAEYLRARIEQYEADAAYRISQNWTLLARVRYDAAIEKFTRQQYGIAWTIGNAWQIETYISINENDARDDDFSVGLRLNLLDF
jgi:LPS-assembly protein